MKGKMWLELVAYIVIYAALWIGCHALLRALELGKVACLVVAPILSLYIIVIGAYIKRKILG